MTNSPIFRKDYTLQIRTAEAVEKMMQAIRTTPAGEPVRVHFLSWHLRRGGWKSLAGAAEQARAEYYLRAHALPFTIGNDAPRHGKQGEYVELSPAAVWFLIRREAAYDELEGKGDDELAALDGMNIDLPGRPGACFWIDPAAGIEAGGLSEPFNARQERAVEAAIARCVELAHFDPDALSESEQQEFLDGFSARLAELVPHYEAAADLSPCPWHAPWLYTDHTQFWRNPRHDAMQAGAAWAEECADEIRELADADRAAFDLEDRIA